MTPSPRESDDVEPTATTPDENETGQPQSDQQHDQQQDEAMNDLGPYDFEVKEQDRWLPIANGELLF